MGLPFLYVLALSNRFHDFTYDELSALVFSLDISESVQPLFVSVCSG